MKYILIIGTKDAGKSTTIQSVCEELHPDNIYSLNIHEKILVKSTLDSIYNNTFLIEVQGKKILVVAGAPTEQKYKITIIIEIIIRLKIKIDFAIIAMRSYERSPGFDTRTELLKFGECILEEQIWKIEGKQYKESKTWKERIDRYATLIRNNW